MQLLQTSFGKLKLVYVNAETILTNVSGKLN